VDKKREKKFLGKVEKVSPLVLTLILVFSLSAISEAAKAASPTRGPRTEDLIIYYYGNVEASYAALKAGDIDMVGYEITSDLYSSAISNLNVVLGGVADSGMYEFDLNNNWTIATYPGSRSPMTVEGFRTALAFLTDKDFIVNSICGGFAERIDQPIAAPYKGWGNSSWWTPNYPYEYDPALAAAELDAAGFVQGSTPNPDYDVAFPGSAQFIREYPWGGDIDPVDFVGRTEDPRRLDAGRLLYGNMKKHGIPITVTEGDIGSIYDKVFGNRNYHVYTGGWSLGRFPALSIYGLFHKSGWWAYGPNYVTGMNASNLPNYPEYDALLEAVRYPPDYATAIIDMKLAAGYHAQHTINIPLWSSLSYWAWSTKLLGVVNMEGAGPENGYTFMNAYKQDGTAIRFGMRSAPNAMNIIYSNWYYDMQCLDRMNLYSGFDVPPYDLSIEQAGFVRDWETGIWNDGGENKTKVTRWFRNDAYFVEPVTGNQKANVNASHSFFTAWYMYQIGDSWDSPAFIDVHHVDVVNNFQVDIYFDTLSYWNTYYATCFMLPIDVFLQPPLAYNATETFVEGINLTTPGVVNLSGKPVWISSVRADGSSLDMFSKYNIIGKGLSSGGKLEIFTNLTDNAVIVVDYWSVGYAGGYTAGNLPWQTIFEGAGMYYATNFTPVCGGLTLKRNPYYWMETPPLGEIDLVWKWHNGPKPRNGSYKIDIYDIVIAAGAYGSQGTGVPDRNWFPSADVAPNGGVIDIFDIVTIASKYGREWG